MRISQEADYALRIILFLSEKDMSKKFDAKEIAETLSLPNRFAVKILRKLIISGQVKSFRGAYGGYAINKKPKDITLLEVVELIDGPITLNKCLEDKSKCSNGQCEECCVRKHIVDLNQIVVDYLGGITFESMHKNCENN